MMLEKNNHNLLEPQSGAQMILVKMLIISIFTRI